MGRNTDFLAAELAAGDLTIGQIRIEPGYRVLHGEDMGCDRLKISTDPHDAILLARYDSAGRFRPLKTAPNLVRGWRLDLSTIEDVLLALDFFYPAAVGTARARRDGELRPVCLRETLGRQTGLYAVTKKLTDEQAGTLIREFCHAGCLREILWPISPDVPSPAKEHPSGPQGLPLSCAEACNLFVAEARKVVKGADSPS